MELVKYQIYLCWEGARQ